MKSPPVEPRSEFSLASKPSSPLDVLSSEPKTSIRLFFQVLDSQNKEALAKKLKTYEVKLPDSFNNECQAVLADTFTVRVLNANKNQQQDTQTNNLHLAENSWSELLRPNRQELITNKKTTPQDELQVVSPVKKPKISEDYTICKRLSFEMDCSLQNKTARFEFSTPQKRLKLRDCDSDYSKLLCGFSAELLLTAPSSSPAKISSQAHEFPFEGKNLDQAFSETGSNKDFF